MRLGTEESGPIAAKGATARALPAAGKSTVREYAEALLVALLAALVIRTFVVQAFKIPSSSMVPTLQIGDHILVNKLAYGLRLPLVGLQLLSFGQPKPGDIIVFIYPVDPSKDFIKRVIAVAGDVVEVRNKRVYVNGTPRDDAHAYFTDGLEDARGGVPRDIYGPTAVPPDHVFVMGDNRDRSYDSRFWGFVSLDEIRGKAFLIYWSWDGADRWVRWERLGDRVY
ncbi:MAG: signal peptidase I [Deltaproteobacteria bacterium]|nr:signal peptidase I [Deltaproteobacteria bacterium]